MSMASTFVRNIIIALFLSGITLQTTTNLSQAQDKISASPCLIANGCVAQPEVTDPIQFPLYISDTGITRGSWGSDIVLFTVADDGTVSRQEIKAGTPLKVDFAHPLSEIAGFKINADVLNDIKKQPAGKPVRVDHRYQTLQSGKDLYLRQFAIGAFPSFDEESYQYVVDGWSDAVGAEKIALPIVSLISPEIKKITGMFGGSKYTFVDKASNNRWYDLDKIDEGDNVIDGKLLAAKQNPPSITWCAKKSAQHKGYSAMVTCMRPETVLNHDYGTSVTYSLPDGESIDITLHRSHYENNPATKAEEPDQLSAVSVPSSDFKKSETLVVILQTANDKRPFQLLAFSKKKTV